MELSNSIRTLTPLKIHIKEVIENSGIDIEKLKFVSKFTVYEDNDGAIFVETIPRMTPTSKQIYINYHWFRQHVRRESVIRMIDSENQKEYIFTRHLQGGLSVRIRKLLCNW